MLVASTMDGGAGAASVPPLPLARSAGLGQLGRPLSPSSELAEARIKVLEERLRVGRLKTHFLWQTRNASHGH